MVVEMEECPICSKEARSEFMVFIDGWKYYFCEEHGLNVLDFINDMVLKESVNLEESSEDNYEKNIL